MIKSLAKKISQKSWYEPLRRSFWQQPNKATAFKITIAIAILSIPLAIIGQGFIGITLALGALAAALAETPDHPRGRIKSLILTIISFIIASGSVELLRPYPIIFALGLVISTITFIIVGGLGERYRGITFGALLIVIYTMLGTEISPNQYYQPLFLSLGALCYGIISLILLFIHPWRPLEEELARGYSALSEYMKIKAKLFPSNSTTEEKIRNKLAVQNIKVVNSLEICKHVFNNYVESTVNKEELKSYLNIFILLQSLHERAASSHEKYEILSQESHNTELLEGLGQLLIQLAMACEQLSFRLLTNTKYKHPMSLTWTVKALHDQLEKRKKDINPSLILLLRNLSQSNISLENIYINNKNSVVPKIEEEKDFIFEKLKNQLSFKHPRMRYAIRLATCFLLAYILIYHFQLTKGDWILLTSLFVCQPSYSETRKKLLQRITGTLIGVIGGVLISQLLPSIYGQLALMLVSVYAFFFWLKKNYSVSVIFITIFVISAFNIISGQGVIMMLPRIIDTLIGSFFAIIVVRFMWPDWQHKNLPTLLANAVDKNKLYLNAIVREYKQTSIDDLDYRIARRQAHTADNALTLAWQGMKMEPKQYRKFQEKAFTLTYLNHALLSYLSAFGSHRRIQDSISTDLIFTQEKVEQIFIQTKKILEGKENNSSGKTMTELIIYIQEKINNTPKGTKRQKLVLLYNIAEVSKQINEQAILMNK